MDKVQKTSMAFVCCETWLMEKLRPSPLTRHNATISEFTCLAYVISYAILPLVYLLFSHINVCLLHSFMTRLLKMSVPSLVVLQMDLDKDGVISYQEFLGYFAKVKNIIENKLESRHKTPPTQASEKRNACSIISRSHLPVFPPLASFHLTYTHSSSLTHQPPTCPHMPFSFFFKYSSRSRSKTRRSARASSATSSSRKARPPPPRTPSPT